MPLSKQEQVANALIRAKGLDYGPRHGNSGALKGSGFYGVLPRTDMPGAFSTEISGEQGGLEFPLIYQGIPAASLDRLLNGDLIPPELYDQAEHAARGRIELGLPAFALEGEQSPRTQIGLPPPRYGLHPKRPF